MLLPLVTPTTLNIYTNNIEAEICQASEAVECASS